MNSPERLMMIARLLLLYELLRDELLRAGHRRKWAVITQDGLLLVEADFDRACRFVDKHVGKRPYIIQPIHPQGHCERIRSPSWRGCPLSPVLMRGHAWRLDSNQRLPSPASGGLPRSGDSTD